MQISSATIHFSPAFNSIAINDAKYGPNQALPFQLLPEKKGGGRVPALSNAAAIHKTVYKTVLPTTGIVHMTEMCTHPQKARGFYLLKIHLYKLLRTTAKLCKIKWFASATLNFQISLCLMLYNKHWVDLMGHRLRNADTAAYRELRVASVPTIMSHTNRHFSGYEDNWLKFVLVQCKPPFCWISGSLGGNKED